MYSWKGPTLRTALLLALLACVQGNHIYSATSPAPGRKAAPPARGTPRDLIGRPAPDFALTDVSGRTWRLPDLRGKHVVVIEFASISCDCGQMAVYDLQELARTFGARGVQILAIGFEAQPLRPPAEFIRDSGLTLPFLTDPGLKTARAYRAKWPPSVVVIDRAGRIHWAWDEFHGDVLRKTSDVIEPLLHADEAWNSNGGYGGLWSRRKPAAAAGVVTATEQISPLKGMSPGVLLTLRKGSQRTRVVVGPTWFIETQPVKIAPKDRVSVTGVSVLVGGKRVMLAREIRRGKDTLRLRDSNGQFPWTALTNASKRQSASPVPATNSNQDRR